MMTEPRGRASRAPGRAGRRRHAAAAGRVLAAGLSAGTAVVLVGILGGAGSTRQSGGVERPPAVVVQGDAGDRGISSGQPAPAVTPSDAPPLTTSQAS
jgi:hypothetical protein